MIKTVKQVVDLSKLQDIIFDDVDKLLKDLKLKYVHIADNYFLCCPIHGGDNPRGCSISTTRRTFKCWTRGCEQERGKNIFNFVQGCLENQSIDDSFSNTLNYLCKLYDFNERVDDKSPAKDKCKINDEFLSLVGIFTQKPVLLDSPYERDIKTVKNSPYFELRGFSPQTLSHFDITDCEDKNSTMFQRSIIPIHSRSGVEVGYIGRATKSFVQPKFLFSKGLNKTQYLYNYHRAIESALRASCLFVVEGTGDVWKLHEAGVQNAVCIFGNHLAELQKEILLKSGVTTLVILLDNDQAGREGKMHIQRNLNRMFTLIFPKMNKKDIGSMTLKNIENHILPQVKGLY